MFSFQMRLHWRWGTNADDFGASTCYKQDVKPSKSQHFIEVLQEGKHNTIENKILLIAHTENSS